MYAVANPILLLRRGLLDRSRSEEHHRLQSSKESVFSKNKKQGKDDKKKGKRMPERIGINNLI